MGPDERTEVIKELEPSESPAKMSKEEVDAKSLENKKKAFEEDPSQFIHMSEMIVCSMRVNGGGQAFYISPNSATELHCAMGELQLNVTLTLMKMKDAARMKNRSSILTPGQHMKRGLSKLKRH